VLAGDDNLREIDAHSSASTNCSNFPATTFAHYRELVKPKQAEGYWNVRPTTTEKIVPLVARGETEAKRRLRESAASGIVSIENMADYKARIARAET